MLREVFNFEGYVLIETSRGDVALALLQATEGGIIVYLEPLFLGMPGNEQLHDYVMNRDERTPQVWILLRSVYLIEQTLNLLRADSSLELPFTADQAFASVEVAQHRLKSKRIPPTSN